MSHGSTTRFGIAPAPDGLALVQDLLNTRQIGSYGDDLLAIRESAASWLREALPAAAARVSTVDLSEQDLTALHQLRSEVRSVVTGDGASQAGLVASASLTVSPSGELDLEPAGTGVRHIAAAVWIEVFLAQRSGGWARLKICRSQECGSAFYDHSKNNSGVWHDVRTCGNRENLRASRARRRAAESRSEEDAPGTMRPAG